MRWEYTAPEKKTFVSDGRKIYSYIPADKQVIVSPVPADDEATTAVLFLAGKGNLTRDFNVSYADGAADGTWALRLDPKQKQRDYDWLVLGVDAKTLQIRVADRGRSAGRALDVPVQQLSREHRASPTACSRSRFRGVPMSSMLARAADRARRARRRWRSLALAGGLRDRGRDAPRPPGRAGAGLRPRRRRVHQRRARQPGEHRGADGARAREAARRRRNTPSAAGGSPAWSATKRRSSSTSSRPS